MNPLTSPQRRALRAKAHALNPVVAIGQHGLTPAVLHEIDVALLAHELIKIRVFSDDRAERELLYARICAELDAAPVQHIGKLLVVWRLAPEPEPEPVAARPAPRKTVKGAKPGTRAPRGHGEAGRADATRPTEGRPRAHPAASRRRTRPPPADAVTTPMRAPTGAPTRRRRGAAQDRPAPAAAGRARRGAGARRSPGLPSPPDQRHPLDATAATAMVVLCALWGFQQVAIKLAAPDISLVMQAAIRSGVATLLLLVWACFPAHPALAARPHARAGNAGGRSHSPANSR